MAEVVELREVLAGYTKYSVDAVNQVADLYRHAYYVAYLPFVGLSSQVSGENKRRVQVEGRLAELLNEAIENLK